MSIGETLSRARGRAGLTLANVSQRTRIRESLIRAIESDDFSGCGGDFYARGHIRSIAASVGTDPEPLVYEYDKSHGSPEAITVADAFEPVRPLRVRERRRSNLPKLLVLAVVVAIGVVVYLLVGGSSHASRAPQAAKSHPAATHHASPAPTPSQHTTPPPSPTPSPTPTPSPSAAAARPLSPTRVTAFGPGGSGQGDNTQLARFAIDGKTGSSWHTDWYSTAQFGGLQHGTGLLVDMGHPVTVTAARLTLGSGAGATVQLRTGDSPSLSGLTTVARAAGASGAVNLQPASPARGRYLLIWITKLPQDSSGTFQESVAAIRVSGQP